MSGRRQHLLTIFAGSLAVVAFFILSSVAVVWANGLRFNPETKRFEQTAVVAAKSRNDIRSVEVFLNGELVSQEIPFQQRNLLPGYYEVLIRKDGFYPWRQTFNLAAGEVGLIKQVELIAESPTVTAVNAAVSFTEPLFDVGLNLTEAGELHDRDKLVSRFVGSPLSARRVGVGYLYQTENELRLHFIEGPQDYLIYQLSSTAPAPTVILSSDWTILVKDGETVKEIRLKVPATRIAAAA